MRLQLHYCPILRALLARVHVGDHTVGFDLYRWCTGLTLFHWNGNREHVRDYGKVGG
jgi:hypothetical protein